MITRKEFLKLGAIALGATATFDAFALESIKKIKSIGVQLFTIPQMVSKDFSGTIKLLSEIGYREIEFFGPYPFSTEVTLKGWESFSKIIGMERHAFFGHEASEIKKILNDYNMKAPSAHLALDDFRGNLGPAMEAFSKIGVTYVAVPILPIKEKLTLDFFKTLADEFNGFGEKMKPYGITFAYHNHGYEHNVLDGVTPMDYLIQNTNVDLVKYELDVFWMKAAGAEPVEYLKKYPGRFKMMHVKNASEQVRFSGDGTTPDQYFQLFGKMADPGQGVFDIKGIINQAIKSGVKHFYVERDLAREAVDTLRNSYEYLSRL